MCLGCWSIVIARAQPGLLLRSLGTPAGMWSLAAGVALTIAVTSLFRALQNSARRALCVPIYGMFIVGGFVLGVLLLDEPLTLAKSVGIIAAVVGVYLISA